MSNGLSDQARRTIIGRYPDWVKKFDVNEYLQNQPMIEKLYEERQMALARVMDLEEEVATLSVQVHELELSEQKLTLQLGEKRYQSFTVFSLSLIAAILVGIGVNIATDNPCHWVGWMMIVTSVVLEVVAFLITRQCRD